MKKIGIIFIITTIGLQLSAQEPGKEDRDENQLSTALDTNDNTKIVIGKDLFSIEDSEESIKVRIRNRGLDILESLEGPKVVFKKFPDDEYTHQEDKDDIRARRRSRFKGHWSGVELGFNNYLTSDNSLVMPADINYMTLHSGKSYNFNLNITQHSFGFTKHTGIVTGLGINWNNYRFDGNNNIMKNNMGVIVIDSINSELEKSKFTTVYLTLPVLLEIQIPADNHYIHISGGCVGALKLGSHTKMVFENRDKVKSHNDLSLNLLRWGPTARLGYKNLQIYATYYMTPLFKTGKGPGGYDLYPFDIGLAFTFND
jgi:hypothetical protein